MADQEQTQAHTLLARIAAHLGATEIEVASLESRVREKVALNDTRGKREHTNHHQHSASGAPKSRIAKIAEAGGKRRASGT